VILVSCIQHTTFGNSGSSSSSIKGDAERDFFVELWDVSGHDRYKDCRSLFYSQINGEYRISFLPYMLYSPEVPKECNYMSNLKKRKTAPK